MDHGFTSLLFTAILIKLGSDKRKNELNLEVGKVVCYFIF